MEISSRDELFNIMNSKDKPKTTNVKVCGICGEKIYRVWVKGVEKWMGCKCGTAKPTKRFLPK